MVNSQSPPRPARPDAEDGDNCIHVASKQIDGQLAAAQLSVLVDRIERRFNEEAGRSQALAAAVNRMAEAVAAIPARLDQESARSHSTESAIARLQQTLESVSGRFDGQSGASADRATAIATLDSVAQAISAIPERLDAYFEDDASHASDTASTLAALADAINALPGRMQNQFGDEPERSRSTSATVSRLAESIDALPSRLERFFSEESGRAQYTASTVNRIAESIDSLPERIAESSNGRAHGVDPEQIDRIRDAVTTLPELARSQAEAIGSLDQQINMVSEKLTAYYIGLNETTNDIDAIKNAINGLQQSVQAFSGSLAGIGQAQTELSSRQLQIAKALNVLREIVVKIGEYSRDSAASAAASTQSLSSALEQFRGELRAHVTEESGRAASRASLGLLFSVIAALAAIGAAVIPFVR